MDATDAISLAVTYIRSHGLDYPTTGLAADGFTAGWSVYAPVDVDETDPMAFLDLPVGQSIFLVGHSGRVKEVSSSVPPQVAYDQFAAEEAGDDFMAEFQRGFMAAGPSPVSSFTVVHSTVDENTVRAEASRLIEPIVQQVAQLGPYGWEELVAEFAFTVSAEIARLRFWTGAEWVVVPVPEQVAAIVRHQRRVTAGMRVGPWWRLLLTVGNTGETAVNYDYGDHPFPPDQLLPPRDYRNDLDAHPRSETPAWLTRYIARSGG
jgi:hypothetical protein